MEDDPGWARGQNWVFLTDLRIKSFAFSEMGTSGGKTNVSFQFITFLYVSCGVSEQKGGYPAQTNKKN